MRPQEKGEAAMHGQQYAALSVRQDPAVCQIKQGRAPGLCLAIQLAFVWQKPMMAS